MSVANNRPREHLHVLDLPAVYTKPTGSILLETLRSLTLTSASFGRSLNTTGLEAGNKIDEKGIPQYLTSIISSSLGWLEDDSLKEEIWESASRRLAERAGRGANSSLTRTFNLSRATTDEPTRAILIHEPSLTGDNLGHKTWSSSYVLSLKLQDLGHLLGPQGNDPKKVLELGSGTGLFGIAFAVLFPNSNVILTDLPEIVPNLECNINANEDLANGILSTMSAADLDWNSCPEIPEINIIQSSQSDYDVVLAADPVYSPSHPKLLVRAIFANLRRSPDARLVIGLPIRDAYLPQIDELWTLLENIGLRVLEEGEDDCTDDWVDQHGELVKVRVKWAVWTWK